MIPESRSYNVGEMQMNPLQYSMYVLLRGEIKKLNVYFQIELSDSNQRVSRSLCDFLLESPSQCHPDIQIFVSIVHTVELEGNYLFTGVVSVTMNFHPQGRNVNDVTNEGKS